MRYSMHAACMTCCMHDMLYARYIACRQSAGHPACEPHRRCSVTPLGSTRVGIRCLVALQAASGVAACSTAATTQQDSRELVELAATNMHVRLEVRPSCAAQPPRASVRSLTSWHSLLSYASPILVPRLQNIRRSCYILTTISHQ